MRVLLTGATGLLGSVLLHDLLSCGHEVLVLARDRDGVPPAARVGSILEALGMRRGFERLRVVEGGAERLGAELARSGAPDAVVHAAAAVKFSSSVEDLLRSNVESTRDILIALDAGAPGSHFHYISTAYVCGNRHGVCREDEGDLGQRFRHPYERSKLIAEAVVREACARSGRPFSVYRPSIIMGSSRDGASANFNGLAQFLKVLDLHSRRGGRAGFRCLRVPCAAGATKNIVPVDWVASSLRRLVEEPRPGVTYHLTHPRPLTHALLRDALRVVLGCEIEIGETESSAAADAGAPSGPLDAVIGHFEPYLRGEPIFDRTHLERDLPGRAEPPPVGAAYLERAILFGRKVAWRSRPLEARASSSIAAPSTKEESHA